MNVKLRNLEIGEDTFGGWIKSTKKPNSKSGLNKYGVIIDVKFFKISLGFIDASIWFR